VDAEPSRGGAREGACVPTQRSRVPPLRNGDSLVAARRRRANDVLVSGLPERRGAAGEVEEHVAVRAPPLYRSLPAFCLSASRLPLADLDGGGERPFAFEEHTSLDRPALYEYRPLVRPFVDARSHKLARQDDARIAIEELKREPAAAIFARAHASARASDDDGLFASVMLPLLVRTAELCGGFDWDDAAYDKAYAELEASMFGRGHSYGAV